MTRLGGLFPGQKRENPPDLSSRVRSGRERHAIWGGPLCARAATTATSGKNSNITSLPGLGENKYRIFYCLCSFLNSSGEGNGKTVMENMNEAEGSKVNRFISLECPISFGLFTHVFCWGQWSFSASCDICDN